MRASSLTSRKHKGERAGIFLYIGASDLLPEAHRRFNIRVVFSTLVGAVTIPTLAILLK